MICLRMSLNLEVTAKAEVAKSRVTSEPLNLERAVEVSKAEVTAIEVDKVEVAQAVVAEAKVGEAEVTGAEVTGVEVAKAEVVADEVVVAKENVKEVVGVAEVVAQVEVVTEAVNLESAVEVTKAKIDEVEAPEAEDIVEKVVTVAEEVVVIDAKIVAKGVIEEDVTKEVVAEEVVAEEVVAAEVVTEEVVAKEVVPKEVVAKEVAPDAEFVAEEEVVAKEVVTKEVVAETEVARAEVTTEPANLESAVEVRDHAVLSPGIDQPVATDISGRAEVSLGVLDFDFSRLGDIRSSSINLEIGCEDVDKNCENSEDDSLVNMNSEGSLDSSNPENVTIKFHRNSGVPHRRPTKSHHEYCRHGTNYDYPPMIPPLPGPPLRATAADACKHNIPPSYSLEHWDPIDYPYTLFASVFDTNSLGKWIYDWTVYHHGPDTPISDMAGELWLLLI
jgi:hypothetical protein